MKLSKIKLAGFKSFVDPTTLPLPSNLVGIIGPNGCGKSNTIDAVRWVMGETSAKHLRGDSMADVIFNGSNTRKPVGQASVELIFDNVDGRAGGQFAHFNEISVKRIVTRDGQSNYYLNGTKCRRRDITDLFLGTGLGPRSYAIIEQGMISRVIEAKPEELRAFLEEAAGISKYKERRRETETRIRHTRDNLDRLNDLREELDKQLARLERQSATAEKYKEYKERERFIKAELLALRWRVLNGEAEQGERAIAARENALQAVLAEQRAVEASLEKQREAHIEATDSFNAVQARYYGVGAEVSRVEQQIQHQKELRHRQEQELARAEQQWADVQAHIGRDRALLAELNAGLEGDEPALEEARLAEEAAAEARLRAEEAMQQWQEGWEEFNRKAAEPTQASQLERAQIEHLERQMERLQQRLVRMEEEYERLSVRELEEEIQTLQLDEAEHEEQARRLDEELSAAQEAIREQRERNRDTGGELDALRGSLQTGRGRLASLEALQQAALGKGKGAVSQWLQGQGLADAPRLAENLEVDAGWERALETVLGRHLEAVCVPGIDAVAAVLGTLEHGDLALVESGKGSGTASGAQPLAARVRSPYAIDSLLAGVQAVEGLDEALALRTQLAAHESVITRDGVWLGPGWLRVARDPDEHAGVLAREHEIKELGRRLEREAAQVEELELRLEEGRSALHAGEERREALQREANDAARRHSEVRAQLTARRARVEQIRGRAEALAREMNEVRSQQANDREQLEMARMRLEEALAEMELLALRREELNGERERLREALEAARNAAREARELSHRLALQVESRRTARNATEGNLTRMDEQLEQLRMRREELQESVLMGEEPGVDLGQQLEELLGTRHREEEALNAARRTLQELEHELRTLEQNRHQVEQRAIEARNALEQARFAAQELKVRRQTLMEQLDETGHTLEELFARIPEEATVQEWEKLSREIGERIARLGPINLAAIDEFKEQQERKVYLDAQYKDLTDALETLENAIRKIDRETRQRFKETFDQVNDGVQELFPRLFGGGAAHLEMTGDDLLDTGISIMAKPPGKNVRSIHLLSGGEKALTAVALVFAIFELNPAPFCMLDEVDAPLDEANVGRFCELIKEKSDKVQFIFITHNKATMEISNQLTGVTMQEPGVSRLVAVDVEEAVQLAAM